ncbi:MULTISPECIES: hypothetical protein [Pseudosulfitobacter]|nr:hypothetical protein [Pseudosulfitobacter pseudonitzschiae]QKS07437.1 hypothetical protein HT745_02555 [Pseudosulfitobacter pseudonitzschiae]
MSLPVDAQGGEKLASMERLYSILLDDAIERGRMCEEYYFLSDEVLGFLKVLQGFDPKTYFPGSRLERAYLILAEPELQMRQAIAGANGFSFGEQPLLPGGVMIVFDDEKDRSQSSILQARWGRL